MSIDIVHPALNDYLLDHATPADDVLRGGRVVDPAALDEPGVVIRELNDAITADERVERSVWGHLPA